MSKITLVILVKSYTIMKSKNLSSVLKDTCSWSNYLGEVQN